VIQGGAKRPDALIPCLEPFLPLTRPMKCNLHDLTLPKAWGVILREFSLADRARKSSL